MLYARNIPWGRFAAEGMVVGISILAAFWIDAWWSDRQDHLREQEGLSSMRAEFARSLVALDEVLDSVRANAANLDQLITILREAGDQPVMVPGTLLGSAVLWRTSDVSTSTLEALIASGDLNRLSNQALRSDLAGLPAFLLDITEDELLARDYAESSMSEFLVREGLAEIAYAHRGGVNRDDAPTEILVTPSPQFIGILMARRIHFDYSLTGLPTVQDYLRHLIDDIDAELAKPNRKTW